MQGVAFAVNLVQQLSLMLRGHSLARPHLLLLLLQAGKLLFQIISKVLVL